MITSKPMWDIKPIYFHCRFEYSIVKRDWGLTHFSNVALSNSTGTGQRFNNLQEIKVYFLQFLEINKETFKVLTQKLKKKEFSFSFGMKGKLGEEEIDEEFSDIFKLFHFFQDRHVMSLEEIKTILNNYHLAAIPEFQAALFLEGFAIESDEIKESGACVVM